MLQDLAHASIVELFASLTGAVSFSGKPKTVGEFQEIATLALSSRRRNKPKHTQRICLASFPRESEGRALGQLSVRYSEAS
jgi:hypothetical protein